MNSVALKLPSVGLGCWKIGKDICAEAVYQAIKAGYRLIDGACDYGNEQEVGAGIKRALDEKLCSRADLFIVSKLWNTFHHPANVPVGFNKSLQDITAGFSNDADKYIDLYLVHFPIHLKFVPIETRYPPEWFYDPKAEHPRMETEEGVTYQMTWQAMEQLVVGGGAGACRNIGVCNLSTGMLAEVLQYAKIKPAVLQVEMHPHLTQQRLLRFARERGITVMAFSNLGALSYVELGMAKDDESLLANSVVAGIAAQVKRTAGQVLLRWAVQRGTVVIPKTTKPERLAENIALFDFELSGEQMAAIDGLNKNRRYNDPGHFCEAAFNTFTPIYD